MRCSLPILMILGISSLAGVAANAAETFVTPSVIYVDDDPKRGADDSVGGQVAVGWQLSDRVIVEGVLGFTDMGGLYDISVLEGSGNVLFSLGPDKLVSPYVLAGVGMMNTTSNAVEAETSALANLGFGLMYGFGEGPLSLRLEWRTRFELYNTITYTDQMTSLALQYSFGKEAYLLPIPTVTSEPDTDNDGTLDRNDVCPTTPAGQRVNSRGCPLDSDGDSVADDVDSCQNTPRGAIVDAAGCEPDNDHDNVPNHLDQCPGTSAGVRVDSKGCEIRAVIELSGVSFESNSDELLPGAESVLIDAAATLRLNQDFIVEVAGHTDSSGAAEYNLLLSKNRANTVLNYLITYGANPARLTARGYGEAKPVADNSTAQGRVANRRVELRILNR